MNIKNTSDTVKSKLGLDSFNIKSPVPFILNLTENNYNVGRVNRYFVGNKNYINITEVNLKDYNNIDLSFYNRVKVNWKISGEKTNVYEDNILKFIGVYELNTISINKSKKIILGIESVLTDVV